MYCGSAEGGEFEVGGGFVRVGRRWAKMGRRWTNKSNRRYGMVDRVSMKEGLGYRVGE